MGKYIKVKEIGEPNNRLAVFVEVLEENPVGIECPVSIEQVATVHAAADPNLSEQERSCEVSFCLVHDKSIRCKCIFRQLGKGSTESTHLVTQGPKLMEVMISADGTEKKPNEYEGIN